MLYLANVLKQKYVNTQQLIWCFLNENDTLLFKKKKNLIDLHNKTLLGTNFIIVPSYTYIYTNMFPFQLSWAERSSELFWSLFLSSSSSFLASLTFLHLYLLLQKNSGYLKLAPIVHGESDSMCSKGGLGPPFNEKII